MENILYQRYVEEYAPVRWFEGLDLESLRAVLLATWNSMLWNPLHVSESLVKFYNHLIDARSAAQFINLLKLRLVFCDMYAWAIPNDEAIRALVKHSPLVEIGAGRGYWAGLAAAAGADILAFDPHPPDKKEVNRWHRQQGTFFQVRKADLDIAEKHPDRTLFLCWPPYDTDVALRTLRKYKGKTVVYIGEHGPAARAPGFDKELSDHFTLMEVVDIPRWPGINDRLEVWRRLSDRTE